MFEDKIDRASEGHLPGAGEFLDILGIGRASGSL